MSRSPLRDLLLWPHTPCFIASLLHLEVACDPLDVGFDLVPMTFSNQQAIYQSLRGHPTTDVGKKAKHLLGGFEVRCRLHPIRLRGFARKRASTRAAPARDIFNTFTFC